MKGFFPTLSFDKRVYKGFISLRTDKMVHMFQALSPTVCFKRRESVDDIMTVFDYRGNWLLSAFSMGRQNYLTNMAVISVGCVGEDSSTCCLQSLIIKVLRESSLSFTSSTPLHTPCALPKLLAVKLC